MAHFENGLFPALKKTLQAATTLLDCNQLYDLPEIKIHASSVSRVSDYLGNLWRKGLLERLPAAKYSDGRSRWLYRWRSGRAVPNLLISIRQKPVGFSYLEGLNAF